MLSPAPWKIVYNTDYYYEPDEDDIANRYISSIQDANGHTVCYTDSGYFNMSFDDAEFIVKVRNELAQC